MTERYYQPINPEEDYAKEDFIKAFGELSSLEKFALELRKDPSNSAMISDLGKRLHSNLRFYEQMKNSAIHARVESDVASSDGKEKISKYVQKNLDEFLAPLDGKEMFASAFNLPLYKTDDEEHKRFIENLREFREATEASKDASERTDYVKKKIEKTPEWLQESLAYFVNDEDYNLALFRQFADDAQIKLLEQVSTKEGIDKSKLERMVRASLDKAQEKFESERDKGKKQKIWEQEIKPYYMVLARIFHLKEKEAQEKREKEDKKLF